MSTTMDRPRTHPQRPTVRSLRSIEPMDQAWGALYLGYTALPIIAGADKFGHYLTDWNQYLSPLVPRLTGLSPSSFMSFVGVVEIAAGVLVAVRPKWGAAVVSLWLMGIVANLLSIPGYFDIALRDFGLAIGAFAFSRMSAAPRA